MTVESLNCRLENFADFVSRRRLNRRAPEVRLEHIRAHVAKHGLYLRTESGGFARVMNPSTILRAPISVNGAPTIFAKLIKRWAMALAGHRGPGPARLWITPKQLVAVKASIEREKERQKCRTI